MSRQLAITKKSTFDAFEGWEDCFVIWRPYTPQDTLDLRNMDVEKLSEDEGFKLIVDSVKEHVVSGSIRILDAQGVSQLVPLETDDVAQFPIDFIMDLYGKITGASFDDPKALPTTAPAN